MGSRKHLVGTGLIAVLGASCVEANPSWEGVAGELGSSSEESGDSAADAAEATGGTETGDGTGDGATSSDGTSDGMTDGGTTDDEGTTDDGGTTDGGTTGGDPVDASHYDGTCESWLWCHDNQDSGLGPISTQECYQVSLQPPFLLHGMEFTVARSESPADLTLEVRTSQGGPGALLATVPLDPAMAEVGTHTIDFSDPPGTPVVITDSSFCVGLSSTGPFGLGIDTAYGSQGTSYLYASGCGMMDFESTDTAPARNVGNWCMSLKLGPMESP